MSGIGPGEAKHLADARVTIVGLGLMGGSLAGALRDQCQSIVGVARRQETVDEALARDLIDWGTTDLERGVREADVVILATPVLTILRQLEEIGPWLPKGCLVLDLGSVKGQIVAKMEELPEHVQPLGGHPMCGKEVAGIEVAESTLYQCCTFVLTPLARTSEAALALGHDLVEAVGGVPLVLDPVRHDRLVATASHLPYLLACALVGTAEVLASHDPMVWDVVAGGFRDTTRVAAGSVNMWLDILATNREAVLEALKTYQGRLGHLERFIASGDTNGLKDTLTTVSARRTEIWPLFSSEC
jgi:prephenate dehydrogenase